MPTENGNGNGKAKQDPLEKLLLGIDAMADKLDTVCSRVDNMERARAMPPLSVEKDGDSRSIRPIPARSAQPAPSAADAQDRR